MNTENSQVEQFATYRVLQSCKFNGDIVITDPYYFLKHAKENEIIAEPRWEDYFPRKQYTNDMLKNPEIAAEFEECNKAMDAAYIKWWENNIDESDLTEAFENLRMLGLKHFLLARTEYGPWTCSLFDLNTNKEILIEDKTYTFTSDSGLVGVFLLDEICEYNPYYRYDLKMPWTAARIPKYRGKVSIVNASPESGLRADIRVIGVTKDDKSFSFYSKQTGM